MNNTFFNKKINNIKNKKKFILMNSFNFSGMNFDISFTNPDSAFKNNAMTGKKAAIPTNSKICTNQFNMATNKNLIF